jgi:hypothetical protein
MSCDKEWEQEFEKYLFKDYKREMRAQYPSWELSWYNHYPVEKTDLRALDMGKATYQWLGWWHETDTRPDIPGYTKNIDLTLSHPTTEKGIVFDITTDPEDDYV